MQEDIDKATEIIENAVGELYRGFFILRQAEEYEEEYRSMDTLINMLIQDAQYLYKKHITEKM